MISTKIDFLGQPEQVRRNICLTLCNSALRIWKTYISETGPISYGDSITGTLHKVDASLPKDAIDSVQARYDMAHVKERYREPIVAMQDDDLEFPDQVEYAYYAIYNLFIKYVLGDDIDEWLIVLQVFSAEKANPPYNNLLARAINQDLG